MMRRSWGRKLMFVFFGKKKDNPRGFPAFVSKTDEERVENQPWRIGDGKTYLVTEKLDGTSCTYALERKTKGKCICSARDMQALNTSCWRDIDAPLSLSSPHSPTATTSGCFTA